LALLLVISAISQSISMMLVTRNRLIQLPPAHLIEGHGVAHALYQGLGTEPNPWGISNDDAVSQEAVLKSNPEAGYGTPLYYHEIGNMYLKIVTTQPLTVMNIYKRKLVKTAKLPLKLFGIPYIWYLILIGSVLLFTVSREALSSKHFCVLTALFGFLMIFIAEEVIIFPELRFIYPAKFGILVLLSIGADFIARKLSIAG
jgi:hypothetical protein